MNGLGGRPLVTVFTSCFNHEPYLDDYFAGLLAQTYEEVELIIFDDGSTDGSWEKISAHVPALERKFVRVVAERHRNMGLLAEQVIGLERATGDLYCLLDSDDYYLPDKLEEDVRYLQRHPEVGFVHSDADYLYPEGIEYGHWRRTRDRIPEGYVFEDLLEGNFVMTCTMCCRMDLYRRHADLAKYRSRGYALDDWPSFLDLARHTRFGYIDRSLAQYRVLPGSASHPTTLENWTRLARTSFQMRVDFAREADVSPQLTERLERDHHRFVYRHGLAFGAPEDSLESLRWLRAHDPARYGRLRHRLAAGLVRLQGAWRLADRLGLVVLGWRTWWGLRLRSAQRSRRPHVAPAPRPTA